MRRAAAVLHRLLEAGIERAGALRALLDSAAAPVLLDARALATVRWRLPVLVACRDAWREGRMQSLLDAAGVSYAAEGDDPYSFLPKWLQPRSS